MVTEVVTGGIAATALLIGVVAGYVIGGRSIQSQQPTNKLQGPAAQLEQPHRVENITDSIESLIEAVDAVIQATNLEDRGLVSSEDDPGQRASNLRWAAESGELIEQDNGTPVDSSDTQPDFENDDSLEGSTSALPSAVSLVQNHAEPQTTEGRQLLEYLETVENVSSEQLADTLRSVVKQLDNYDAVEDTLREVRPHLDAQALAQTLTDGARTTEEEVGDAFETIGRELSTLNTKYEQCESERKQLARDAERICQVASEQATISLDSTAGPSEWLSSLSNHIEDGSVSFADRENTLPNIVPRLALTPESTLSGELVDILTSHSLTQAECDETLNEVIDTIDRAKTTKQRLQGVDPDNVAQLASRVADEFQTASTAVSSALQERAAELETTVRSAGESDLISVYAARQELRFYDHGLLSEIQSSDSESASRDTIDSLATEVEERRSTMRTQYPSEYPEYDHSIPIHFLELVGTLQEGANEAGATGNPGQAIGYLRAAEKTLDWVAELYERHAYSVLLEQLRG